MPRPSSICTSRRAPKAADSPLPSTPSASPSSPLSPSSPSSPSTTSPGRMVTGYRQDEDGGRAGSNGVCVSSTSNPSRPYGSGQRDATGTEMYDPFQPTEGDGGPGAAEDEGDKYDPFEPTGSPVSDKEEEREMDDEREEGDDGGGKADLETPPRDDGPPPDSTEALNRNRIIKLRERRRSSRERSEYDSEHSELEEGEIVGAGEGAREVAIRREVLLPSSGSPSFLAAGGLKPERILRVLDGEDFVSVRAEGEWEAEPAPQIGAGDLRRKLTNRRKQRFRSCPSSASVSPPPAPTAGQTPPPPGQAQSAEKSAGRKSTKSSKERERRKRKGPDKDKRKKRKDVKAESSRGSGESKDREGEHERRGRKEEKDKEQRRSKSRSRSRKATHPGTPEPILRSHNASVRHARRSWSRERNRDRERDRDREKDRERDRYRDRRRDDRERDPRRRDGRKREAEEAGKRSSSRERGLAKRRRDSSERRDQTRDRGRERDLERRNNRPVVPPSIQDLNGPELFAIKRTITVTPAPAPRLSGSPPRARVCSGSPQDSDKSRRHRRKRRRHSEDEARPAEEHGSRSHNSSLTPLRYHGYESDRVSERPEPDMLSLDGEALDSDYPSLEDSPLLPPPLPEPLVPSPKPKSSPQRSSRHHLKKKSRSGGKKPGPTEAAVAAPASHRPKAAGKPSLSTSSGNTNSLPTNASTSAKRGRKAGKDKPSKKSSGRSGRSKKAGGRKTKLQSKVSVLVREGVSSTTGNSGKLGLDLLGPAGPSVGGSIAVVFRRDNESRSPFLKPCSEPLSLPGRAKDPSKPGKARGALSGAHAPGLKSKKVKPSSTTSTSSSASSPTSSLAAKRRRRPGRKLREKGPTTDGPDGKGANGNSAWAGASPDVQPLPVGGPKPSSPPSALLGPAPSSSSSSSSSTSSTSVLPPSSSPPHTPPLSLPPSRDTRDSSPDSQTVDSSCKTPEPSFLSEECPAQSQSATLVPSKSPPSPPPQRLDATVQPAAKPPGPDEPEASPPASVSAPPPAVEPSSSSSASVSSSSITKQPPPPPPPAIQPLPWNLQTGMDCTAGGVLALTALLFKMEEANLASRAKAQEFIQATSQILSQANQNPPQNHPSSSSQIPPPPPPPSHAPPPGPASAQFILHGSLPLVSCTKTPPSHLHPGISLGGGYAQTPPPPLPTGLSGSTGGTSETSWDGESKDPDKYLKKLHTQERAVEEVKLAIKPYYQRKDINKDEYKDILRKAVHKICHSRTGEINPVKVSNLVKLYVQRYKYFRKHGRKMDDDDKEEREAASLHSST